MDWLTLSGRPALVVGAGGLGGASAVALAAQGAPVVLVDLDEERLESVSRAAKDAGGSVRTIAADLRSARRCREVVAEASGLAGVPQIFVHAVGRNVRRPVLELGDEDWRAIVELNLSTAYWLGRAVGALMVEAGYGRMTFVSSVSGLLAHADHAAYAATKGGLNQLLRVMAREWAARGVTVNAVAPGYIETGLTRDHLDRDGNREALESLVPARRLGVPEEIADAVTFLSSDRARFITGQVLYVDGGRVLV
ncbi:SDR family NAD(P)-dependent oxidoreductase [Amorphoplanes digitatis]|uniref:NAD(P)-dependent dehydrogenase (Short-subunit alcohol dehydrogenase family) n=1 Tax=Actinoplanes digitatis TaxID=1868 RepID=A0A7W7HW69_9ACTN|nr:SDR family NAD(P)-dependent oxidoreductase [Actinoplanes digitatis]MBB4761890.1 NAD(P)-dependent dehydrogenase (short-subunit alcohol dehydrogenase family) [Actinoplanes digitatis]GID91002.1 gluconate 5-dehydrogenase [Actinoplanes digitatis]